MFYCNRYLLYYVLPKKLYSTLKACFYLHFKGFVLAEKGSGNINRILENYVL